MDVDLSTDLAALLPLVAPLISGHSDLAIGSRLRRSSRVVRGPKREFISRCYNLLLRARARPVLRRPVRIQGDAGRVARGLLPHVEDTAGSSTPNCSCSPSAPGCGSTRCRSTGSTTRTAESTSRTALADLRGIARLGRALVRGDLPLRGRRAARRDSSRTRRPDGWPDRRCASRHRRAVSTLAYAAVPAAGALGAQAANLLALLRDRDRATPPPTGGSRSGSAAAVRRATRCRGCVVFALGLALTSGALWLLALATARTAARLSSSPSWSPPTCSPPPCASSCCALGLPLDGRPLPS